MGYERQCFLNARPYERTDQRVDQANGFYGRQLTTRLGVLDLRVPRTRSGCFQSRVLPRYQRREPVVNDALKQVFLLGVSTRQPDGPWPRGGRSRQRRGQSPGCDRGPLASAPAERAPPLSDSGRDQCADSLGGRGSTAESALCLWPDTGRKTRVD